MVMKRTKLSRWESQCHTVIVNICQLKDKLFISEINLTRNDELDKMTEEQATSIGLMGIASFGGFFVQVGCQVELLTYFNLIFKLKSSRILSSWAISQNC